MNVYHTNPLSPDSDADGLDDKEEVSIYQTNPNAADTDGDGIKDKSEVRQGADPNNAASTPQFESLEVIGDEAVNVRKSEQITITLPAGDQKYLVIVTALSEEYPHYTGLGSEFDDVLDWEITSSGGALIQGD